MAKQEKLPKVKKVNKPKPIQSVPKPTDVKKEQIQSADVVKTASGRQYHIGLAPGELAPYILMCGDLARAERVSKLFERIDVRASNREYITFTGVYQNIPVSIMATGIGCDNTEIAIIELLQCVEKPTLIRIGSCGGLQAETKLGDLVISTGALRLENTSTYFVPEGYPAVAHYEVVLALSEACKHLEVPFHRGITATAPGFYGAQGRIVPGFTPRYPNIMEDLAKLGIMNFEMETSTLLTLSSLAQVRAGSVCAIYANRYQNAFVSPEQKDKAEWNCIQAGLTAVQFLYRVDQMRQKQQDPTWLPIVPLLQK